MIRIIWNEFRMFIRNPYLVGLLVFFPVLFVYVLGSFLEGTQVFEKSLEQIEIEYQLDDKSPLAESFTIFLEQSENNQEKEDTFHFVKAKDQEESLLRLGK